ncbi:uncharacterized protein HD556DRAFT_1443789 [Suillus plorans]|uniref:Uncharacterized protein n=1 Tax=Suillus plorans TaxID=116603 RepID=A0A9P7AQM9_9AGAM|nr:uncharacterized protein HD556DRAFT_1443785 [Suillus plorans]XP_041159807.1 uncharacterized protein HD556DRAFT_1443789 [Suillus plorans]KAG1793349.1 hypothetical protein HD556DRAFT_1443785 [Suillus plorans]KAG1793351.1 hypothetical protein HD556DRAFT_1443789 [Suillus plorans]
MTQSDHTGSLPPILAITTFRHHSFLLGPSCSSRLVYLLSLVLLIFPSVVVRRPYSSEPRQQLLACTGRLRWTTSVGGVHTLCMRRAERPVIQGTQHVEIAVKMASSSHRGSCTPTPVAIDSMASLSIMISRLGLRNPALDLPFRAFIFIPDGVTDLSTDFPFLVVDAAISDGHAVEI